MQSNNCHWDEQISKCSPCIIGLFDSIVSEINCKKCLQALVSSLGVERVIDGGWTVEVVSLIFDKMKHQYKIYKISIHRHFSWPFSSVGEYCTLSAADCYFAVFLCAVLLVAVAQGLSGLFNSTLLRPYVCCPCSLICCADYHLLLWAGALLSENSCSDCIHVPLSEFVILITIPPELPLLNPIAKSQPPLLQQ